MKKLTYILLYLCMISCSTDPPKEVEYDYTFNDNELELIDKINQHRLNNNLSQLQTLPHLGYLSSKNNQEMIKIGTICNCYLNESVNSVDRLYNTPYVSQIALVGYNSAQGAMNGILGDTTSKNIIEKDFTDIGISISESPTTGKKYYTVLIIKR